MVLQPADYVVIGLAVLMTAMGLFRGFSGAFAFLVATSLGASAVATGWTGFLASVEPVWVRAVAAIVVFVTVFGVIRLIVKFVVGKLLAQPSDSIFGVCLGLACGGLLVWALAHDPVVRSHSFIAREVHARLW